MKMSSEHIVDGTDKMSKSQNLTVKSHDTVSFSMYDMSTRLSCRCVLIMNDVD
jgi:hypothetical protein